MLNKKVVTIREYWENEGLVEYESMAVGVADDKEYKDAIAHPWKYISGAIRHFFNRVQIWMYRLVEEFRDLTASDMAVLDELYQGEQFYISRTGSNAYVYERSLKDSVRADLTRTERLSRLAWLVPYVQQWKLDDKSDTISAPDGSMFLKAVTVTV